MLVSLSWLLEHVDRKRLCFSFPLENAALEQSIREYGMQTPLTVVKVDHQAILLNGHRRVEVLKKLHSQQPIEMLVREIQPAALANVFAAHLSETQSTRALNLIEKARVLDIAQKTLALSAEEAALRWLPRLALRPTLKSLAELGAVLQLSNAWQTWIVDKDVPLRTVHAMASLTADEQGILWEIVAALGFGKNLLEEALHEMTLIARRENRPWLEVARNIWTTQPPFESGDRAVAFRKVLRQRAYPQVHEMQKAFDESTRALNLPSSISLKPPAFFEGTRYDVHFQFGSSEELDRASRSLQEAASQDELTKLLHLL